MTDGPRFSSDRLFSDLADALQGRGPDRESDDARLDTGRMDRVGTPEIILAGGKRTEQVISLTRNMLDRAGRVLISRVDDSTRAALERTFGDGYVVECPAGSQIVRISSHRSAPAERHGCIAIFTAGTSDVGLAHEARLVSEEMGCQAKIYADVGVAGIHRLVRPFREAIDSGAKVIIVVAGMDGALPSVVAGLSPVPVIGLPSSVGYGFGGNGEAALMSMLQTCAPGLTVVNIDNSVGAGVAAARIAIQSSSTS